MKIKFGAIPVGEFSAKKVPHIWIPKAERTHARWTDRRGIVVIWEPTSSGIHDPFPMPYGGAWIVCISKRGGWMGRMRAVAREIAATAVPHTSRAGGIAAERRGMWRDGD